MKFINFFHFWGPISNCLDPDPVTQLNLYPIRIRNTGGMLLFKTDHPESTLLCTVDGSLTKMWYVNLFFVAQNFHFRFCKKLRGKKALQKEAMGGVHLSRERGVERALCRELEQLISCESYRHSWVIRILSHLLLRAVLLSVLRITILDSGSEIKFLFLNLILYIKSIPVW